MDKVCGPIFMGISPYPITTHREPSKDFTIRAMGFIETSLRVNFRDVVFGMTFNDDHKSTNTRDRIVSIHFIKMYMVLL